jgi:hypothetical protein
MSEPEQPTTPDEEKGSERPEMLEEEERDLPVPEGGHGPASEEEPPENGGDDE